ncbi:MAG: DUF1761 domain-containing protein [Crocinitomicaceae bacterium]
MEPLIKLNFIAIGIGTLAFFFLGFLWYTPLFGKIWAKEMGFSRDMEVSKSFMIRSLLLNLFGNFLLAFVLSHNIFAWDARSWGHDSNFVGQGQAAAMSAIFTWLGFFLPQDLSAVTWQMKSWKLFFINTSYHLVGLLIVSMILVFMS